MFYFQHLPIFRLERTEFKFGLLVVSDGKIHHTVAKITDTVK